MPKPGEIWLAEITFTTGVGSKIRPVLILWIDAADAVVAAVTSAVPRSATDVAIVDWQKSGLRVPSTARLSRLDCLEQKLFIWKLGSLTPPDAQAIKNVWSTAVHLGF